MRADMMWQRAASLVVLLLGWVVAVSAQDASVTAHMRVGHFSIDAGALDIYVDDTLISEGLISGTVRDWRAIAPGTHTITVVVSGGQLSTPLLVPQSVAMQADQWLTLALIGRRSDGSLRLHTITEDFSPIGAGETRISIFNAFNNNPPLNVAADGVPLVRLLAYPNTLEEGNDGLETVNLLAGTYNLVFSLTDGQRVTDITGIGLGRNRHYLIAILGTLDSPRTVIVTSDQGLLLGEVTPAPEAAATSTPLRVVLTPTPAAATLAPTVPAEATAEVTAEPIVIGNNQALLRVGHFAPGVANVTIYLNNAPYLEALEYPEISAYTLLEAGTYDVAVVLAGETLADAVLRQTVTIEPNSVNTLMNIGALSNGSFLLQPIVEDYTAARAGLARLALFNAMPDSQFITLLANQNDVLVQGLAFPGVFEGAGDGFITFDVLAGTYELEVSANDVPMLNLGEIRMGAGRYYFIVIAGTSNSAFFVLQSGAISDITAP